MWPTGCCSVKQYSYETILADLLLCVKAFLFSVHRISFKSGTALSLRYQIIAIQIKHVTCGVILINHST